MSPYVSKLSDLGFWLVSIRLFLIFTFLLHTCKIYFDLVMNEMLIEIDNHQVTYHNIPTYHITKRKIVKPVLNLLHTLDDARVVQFFIIY